MIGTGRNSFGNNVIQKIMKETSIDFCFRKYEEILHSGYYSFLKRKSKLFYLNVLLYIAQVIFIEVQVYRKYGILLATSPRLLHRGR